MHTIKRFLQFSTPLYVNIIILLGFATFMSGWYWMKTTSSRENFQQVVTSSQDQSLIYLRSHNYKLIQPVLFADLAEETKNVAPLKQKLQVAIDGFRQRGLITDASVFFKEFNNGSWFSINSSAQYNPGSLVKVVILTTFLKSSESHPGLLDTRIYFKPDSKGIPHQTYEINPLISGQSYTIRELLKRMSEDSDNSSTALLISKIDLELFKQVYADLDQIVPPVNDINFQTNVVDYSKFMRVLFNGSYLNSENSEMALNWLTQSSFKEGLTKFLPGDVLVAHKFGEFGLNLEKQWHESGIIYCGNRPYLITVFTRGMEIENLRQVISELSKQVYDSMKPNS